MEVLRRACEEAFRDNSGGVHRASDAEALMLASLQDLGFACEVPAHAHPSLELVSGDLTQALPENFQTLPVTLCTRSFVQRTDRVVDIDLFYTSRVHLGGGASRV